MEDIRNVQVKKRGNIWGRQSSPPHSMHNTNLVDCINEEKTPEQQFHSSQHYHLQQSPDRTSIPITTHRRTSGELRCIRKDYIREEAPSRKEVGIIELEQEGRKYKLVSKFEQIIYEHCILRQARGRVYTCFVYIFIVLRVMTSLIPYLDHAEHYS